MTNALLVPGSGINITSSSLFSGAPTQQGTYTGFNLAPSSGLSPTLVLGDGVLLISGSANLPLTNTLNQFSGNPGNGGLLILNSLGVPPTQDANALSYSFTTDAMLSAVTMKFVFGTDEFPTQSVTDVFGFFVDGVNYAKFAGVELISNTPGNQTNFISNPVGSELYEIE